MLLQAGGDNKPAMFTLERSDYLHCPKHALGFHGMSSQIHTLDTISRDHQIPPNSKTLITRTILMLLPPEILSPMHHKTYCISLLRASNFFQVERAYLKQKTHPVHPFVKGITKEGAWTSIMGTQQLEFEK